MHIQFARFRALAAWLAGACLACAAIAHADPVTVKSGLAPLPASGLQIDLPLRKDVEYHLSSSWALDGKGSFDARDIVDEFDAASGSIIAGNWVLTGYFDAGGCDAVLGQEKLDKVWQTEADIWGQHWKVHGGIFTFDNASLGRRPAAILCTSTADSGRSLLLYRFLVDQSETLDQSSVLENTKSSGVLERAWKSYRDKRVVNVFPLKRQEVRNRGSIPASRTVTLAVSELRVDLPDDGYVWLANEGDASDMLDRMAPSLPDITVEVAIADGQTCPNVLSQLKTDIKAGHEATSLPAGWVAGGAMTVDGETELLVCYPASYGALVAGVMQGPQKTDVSDLHPLLASLSKATR